MQKQLKLLDKQLTNNDMIRIQDITHKHQNSLFRALSMAVYYSHHYTADIKRDLKLTLINNLADKRTNAYPAINQTCILKKYLQIPNLIMEYWQQPDLNCFHHDTLVIASAAFGKTVCIMHMDRQEYLNQTYISACKNPDIERITLAKAGKKYYAVLKNSIYQTISFVKESIIEDIIKNSLFQESQTNIQPKQDKIHYPTYDEVVTVGHRHGRQHKKSLSDAGDLPLQVQVSFDQRGKQFQQNSERSFNLNNAKVYNRLEEEFFDSNNYMKMSSLQSNLTEQQMLDGNYKNYYAYPYHYVLPTEQAYGYVEPPQPINNERYTGRLKFFDQAGNYGFIVIDNLNIDLFVHFDDLSRAGLSKDKLMSLKNNYQLRFQFTYYEYEGKQHKKSKKAIDLLMIPSQTV